MHLLAKLPPSSLTILLVLLGGTARAGVNFKEAVLPILEAKCVKCHQAERVENGKTIKPKKDLRLDAAWAILKGGETKSHPALVPRDAAKSYIYEVVTLPKDDDMFMPPKGDPLTEEEIVTLKTWIDEGADFGGWEGNLTGKPGAAAVAATAPTPAKPVPVPQVNEHEVLYKKLAEGLAPATPELLKAASATGAQIHALSPDSPLLRVDFLTGVSKCDDKSVAGLTGIQQQIAHLDLARTQVTDAALRFAAQLPRLVRLDLRQTKVGDHGIEALSASKSLSYVNLFGTEVTDAGLASLASVKTLRNVYLFDTKVTEAGVAKLKAALPGAEVVADVSLPEHATPATPMKGKKAK